MRLNCHLDRSLVAHEYEVIDVGCVSDDVFQSFSRGVGRFFKVLGRRDVGNGDVSNGVHPFGMVVNYIEEVFGFFLFIADRNVIFDRICGDCQMVHDCDPHFEKLVGNRQCNCVDAGVVVHGIFCKDRGLDDLEWNGVRVEAYKMSILVNDFHDFCFLVGRLDSACKK